MGAAPPGLVYWSGITRTGTAWRISRKKDVLSLPMNLRGRGIAALVIIGAGVALAGCGKAATGSSAATTSAAAWAPADYFEVGDVAFKFMEPGDFDCKSYQDDCFGISVVSQNRCPNGIYIEVAVTDPSGTIVGKANEITAATNSSDVVKAVLAQPGGSPTGSRAKISKLNCLGG
jgi:hypothetical protein